MGKELDAWICECGTVCYATSDPTKGFPKWNDGHTCKFRKMSKEEISKDIRL